MLEDTINKLFKDAESNGAVEYVYTLLRVTGPEVDRSDSLVKLRARLKDEGNSLPEGELLSLYCSLATNEAPLELLANLLNCVRSERYTVVPFSHLNKGKYPEKVVEATLAEKVEHLSSVARETGRVDLSDAINAAYPVDILEACLTLSPTSEANLHQTYQNCRSLLATLIDIHFSERLKCRSWPTFFKVSPFEVIELLTNEDYGLYGFKMHFPSGGEAWFERHPERHDGRNFFVPEITFFVGLIDEMQNAWKLYGKQLHEFNFPGRYNRTGEWKPIVTPMGMGALSQECRSLSDDPEVQGALFYIFSTGFRGIEFVVRTNIDLPHDDVSFGQSLHLWKCPPLDENPLSNSNFRIYDGWFELESVEPEDVRHAIAMIGVALNRMAFAYDASLAWRIKYRLYLGAETFWAPTEEDTKLLNSLLKDFPQSEDAVVLDAAIDWYTRGRSSQNVFTAFLCYYVAVESVARAIVDGEADFGLNFHKGSKSERREVRLACIREMYDRLYTKEPERFIREAYFDCIVGLKEKTRRVVELVFGQEHSYINLLFEKGPDGHSLNSIRGQLAHGDVTQIDRDHEKLVRARLREIAVISKEFLTRLIFFLKPGEALPSWSRTFVDSLHFTDPRSTMFVNSEIPVSGKDWRIRPEWID
jgi:hypothetical protein